MNLLSVVHSALPRENIQQVLPVIFSIIINVTFSVATIIIIIFGF